MSFGLSTGSIPGRGSSGASVDSVAVAGTVGILAGGADGLGDGALSTGDSLQLNKRARATTRKHNGNNREGMKSMLAYLLIK
jgi:hypothetical protein